MLPSRDPTILRQNSQAKKKKKKGNERQRWTLCDDNLWKSMKKT